MDRFDEILNQIVTLEWDMFQAVNEGGPRADCQDDRSTFEGMRRAQFKAWSQEACERYLDDLLNAVLDSRNLITEKYIHMMRFSAPSQYDALKKTITLPDEQIEKQARLISDKLIEQTASLFEKYPYVSGSGRPLHAVSDFSGVTSIETYQLGELLTYSVKTLTALKKHLDELEQDGKALARMILENSVKHYGYKTLEQAEASTKVRIDKDNEESSTLQL